VTVGFQCQLVLFCYFFLQDFKDSRICFVMRFQRRFVFVGYEISIMVGFAGSRDLNNGRFSVSVFFVLL